MRPQVAAALAAALLGPGAAGCVHVRTNDPRAILYFDGRAIGPGEGRLVSIGLPRTARVVAIAPDGRRARALVERELSSGAIDAALHGAWPCLLLCWTYPPEVVVPLPPARAPRGWDDDAADPWARGPGSWDDPPAPRAAAPP